MGRRILSDAEARFLRDNCRGRSARELAQIFNSLSGRDLTYEQVRSFLKRNHLSCGTYPKIRPWNSFPEEHGKFILANYCGVGPTEMTGMVNERFGTSYSSGQIRSWYKNHHLDSGLTGRFEKGQLPWSAGKKPQDMAYRPGALERLQASWYGKGSRAHNHLPVGSVRTRKPDGYRWIKVAEPNRWRLLAMVVWEKEHGPVPRGYLVIHKDGDPANDDLSNLMLIGRRQHSIVNGMKLQSRDPEIMEASVALADAIVTIRDKEKKI